MTEHKTRTRAGTWLWIGAGVILTALALAACLGRGSTPPAPAPSQLAQESPTSAPVRTALPPTAAPTQTEGPPPPAPAACRGGEDYRPQWSWDGTHIYYLESGGPDGEELRVMAAGGADDRLLGPNINYPQPSPDGTQVLYRDNGTYFLLDTRSLATRKILTYADQVSWSPDSRWLLYVALINTPGAVFKRNVATGQDTHLIDYRAPNNFPNPLWSPDGRRIAYASIDGPADSSLASLHTATADGTDIRPLSAPASDPGCSAGGEGDAPTAWLADGSGLVFNRTCGKGWAAHIVTLKRVETDLSALGNSLDVRVSPDGRSLLFIVVHENTSFGDPLNVAAIDGSNRRVLDPKAVSPSWSPGPAAAGDGERIVFSKTIAEGRSAIFTIKPDGSGLTQLTQNSDEGVCQH